MDLPILHSRERAAGGTGYGVTEGRRYTRAIVRSATVLVVDDDAAIRLLCRINLELDGHDVLEAATAQDARTAVAATQVDVVLLDLRLGAASGEELLAELRRDHPDLGIVLMTGSADSVSGNPAANAVLAKPFELDELRDAVARSAARDRHPV